MNTALSAKSRREEAGTSRLVKVMAMLLLPVLVIAIASCGDSGGNRAPYAGVPEGKPPGLGAPIPDPKEVVETRTKGQLPDFVMNMDEPNKDATIALYQGAVDQYDAYGHVPCYCGCAAYTTAHQSLAQCFIKEMKPDGQITFTDHSLTCDLCQSAAKMTLEGQKAGTPLKDTRMNIFNKLKYTGIWTDTPPVQ